MKHIQSHRFTKECQFGNLFTRVCHNFIICSLKSTPNGKYHKQHTHAKWKKKHWWDPSFFFFSNSRMTWDTAGAEVSFCFFTFRLLAVKQTHTLWSGLGFAWTVCWNKRLNPANQAGLHHLNETSWYSPPVGAQYCGFPACLKPILLIHSSVPINTGPSCPLPVYLPIPQTNTVPIAYEQKTLHTESLPLFV